MGDCCSKVKECAPCETTSTCCSSGGGGDVSCPLTWFENMIGNCYEYALEAKKSGKPIVGIMCEYTPRELIMAAGAVPVCLCGGSADTISSAEKDLPANLCPLIKSTYGYHVEGSNPFLEMSDLIVAETTCDGKKKMYELMAETRPMYVLELPQKPDDPDAFEHWVTELKKLRAALNERLEVEIKDDCIRKAIRDMNRERALRRGIAALMKSPEPPLTGSQVLDLKSSISCIPADMEQYEKALDVFSGAEEAKPGAVRVLMTGVPVAHGAERVVDIIEKKGGIIVCAENCTGVKPIMDDVAEDAEDPVRALAEKYFKLPCSVMTKNDARIELLKDLAGEYRADCIIELVWQACITYDVESNRVKRLAEELGIPYLRIETDYSPSDSERIGVRVEALFETVKGNK